MKITAYYLLILYTFAVCKPVVPIVKDTLAHIFWKANHIATVHLQHGNAHTAQEIEEETNENNKKKAESKIHLFETQAVHTTINIFKIEFIPIVTTFSYAIHRNYVVNTYKENIYIPPKA